MKWEVIKKGDVKIIFMNVFLLFCIVKIEILSEVKRGSYIRCCVIFISKGMYVFQGKRKIYLNKGKKGIFKLIICCL